MKVVEKLKILVTVLNKYLEIARKKLGVPEQFKQITMKMKLRTKTMISVLISEKMMMN